MTSECSICHDLINQYNFIKCHGKTRNGKCRNIICTLCLKFTKVQVNIDHIVYGKNYSGFFLCSYNCFINFFTKKRNNIITFEIERPTRIFHLIRPEIEELCKIRNIEKKKTMMLWQNCVGKLTKDLLYIVVSYLCN